MCVCARDFLRRICHCEGDDDCPLIMPCRCTGSLSFVHQGCLNQWIKSSDTRCCELCKFDFVMETKLKPLRKVSTSASAPPVARARPPALSTHNPTPAVIRPAVGEAPHVHE